MKPTNFTRTNVAPSSVVMTSPERSSYDLSHRSNITLPVGKFIPVNIEKLIPGSTSRLGLSPSFSLETLNVPEVGRMRLDQHTFAVSARRINRDFRLFFEGDELHKELPTFDFPLLVQGVLHWIFTRVENTNNVVDGFEPACVSANPAYHAYLLLSSASLNYRSRAKNAGYDYNHVFDFDYLHDFYNVEASRLHELAEYYKRLSSDSDDFNNPITPNEWYARVLSDVDDSGSWGEVCFEPFIAIYEILKPYFGEGSLFDMLGMHTVKRYSKQLYRAAAVYRNNCFTIGSSFQHTQPASDGTAAGACLRSFYHSFNNFYADVLDGYDAIVDNAHLYNGITFSGSVEREAFLRPVSEMELRAYYSVWYDQLRNWHFEKRSNLHNPDLFDSTPVLDTELLKDFTPSSPSYEFMRITTKWLSLLLPRYCNWSKDIYTTIQPEDKFRYVFAPLSGDAEAKVPVDSVSSPDSLNGIIEIVSDEFNSIFPYGQLFRDPLGNAHGVLSCLRADLNTMRRAGMLEKYLARTYYHPDTYAGQITARFGIEPQDIDLISSRYLFGQESLVEGEQVKNATGTEETPAGLRTLVAGVGNEEGTLYQNGAEFTYVISLLSLVPLVTYDPLNMHMFERYLLDLPTPEFANDTRITITPNEFMRDCIYETSPVGYVPRYYQYRLRADEAHGDYLTDKRAFVWLNDTYRKYFEVQISRSQTDPSIFHPSASVVKWLADRSYNLDAYDMHIHLTMDAFLNLREWDNIAYGKVDIVFETNTILPGAVDIC